MLLVTATGAWVRECLEISTGGTFFDSADSVKLNADFEVVPRAQSLSIQRQMSEVSIPPRPSNKFFFSEMLFLTAPGAAFCLQKVA